METRTMLRLVSECVTEKKFADAEALLTRAKAQAVADHDLNAERLILSELIELYCVMNPPDTTKAERISLEREALDPSSKGKWQTAMLLYWHKHEPEQALAKLTEATVEARNAGDSGVVYSCLALSGLALLDLDRLEDAAQVLEEIEGMVLARKPFVVGDETLFLERARSVGLNLARITQVASSLIPICRDPAVARRLSELHSGR